MPDAPSTAAAGNNDKHVFLSSCLADAAAKAMAHDLDALHRRADVQMSSFSRHHVARRAGSARPPRVKATGMPAPRAAVPRLAWPCQCH